MQVGHLKPVSNADLDDSVLVVLGHGTELNDQSAAPVWQHAGELRRRQIFREVREAFWKQAPQIQSVLPQISAPRVFIVPLFISDGYFAGQLIPRALGFESARNRREETRITYYCQPVGTHESMTQLILSRAAGITRQFSFPHAPKRADTTLFIAGHGTEKNANSRRAIERQAELIRSQGLYADVQAVFMEEDPRISACGTIARTKYCVVVPFFVADGLHVMEDIPALLGETKPVVEARLAAGQPTWRNPAEIQGKLIWYTSSAPIPDWPMLSLNE